MSYKPNDNYYGLVTTRRIDTGALADADSMPTAAAYRNGSFDPNFALSVASLGAGSGGYTISGTIPGDYQKGDVVQIVATATVNSVTDASPIDSLVLDSKRVGDLQDPSVAAIQSGLMPAASYVAPDNADIAAIKAKTNNLPAQPAAVGSEMDLVGNPNSTAVAALNTAAWGVALSTLTTTGSIGRKLASWALGSDDKVLLSSDPQTGVTIPTVNEVEAGVELDSSQDIYPADVEFVPNDSDGLDEYTVAWFRNGTPLTVGIAMPTIEVTQRSDGTDLVPAGTAMIAVGGSGLLKYDEPTFRLAAGATAIVTVSATIDGATRTWRRLVMRADS
ncbi:MAG TPA: hypothetical protein VIK18_06165 [Pirellulales bacterium]